MRIPDEERADAERRAALARTPKTVDGEDDSVHSSSDESESDNSSDEVGNQRSGSFLFRTLPLSRFREWPSRDGRTLHRTLHHLDLRWI